jgi:hypothetical protein
MIQIHQRLQIADDSQIIANSSITECVRSQEPLSGWPRCSVCGLSPIRRCQSPVLKGLKLCCIKALDGKIRRGRTAAHPAVSISGAAVLRLPERSKLPSPFFTIPNGGKHVGAI